jgi:cysteine desulfurase family protein
MIYLDNAATSWPKPPGVAEAVAGCISEAGANPGRAGHRLANDAARLVYDARAAVSELLGAPDPLRVILGPNVTWALNLALRGLLRPGDQVITSSMEHNAVMRPLRALEAEGVGVCVVPCGPDGRLDPQRVADAITARTTLVAMTHASNVVGTLLPVAEVAGTARQHGIPLLLDTAQTAGAVPIDMAALGVDLLAFTGHKSLLGPMGSGGLILGEGFDHSWLEPLVRGGTGSRSEEQVQPDFLPDKYEAGTMNVPGLAGLAAGIRWVQERGVAAIQAQERALTQRLIDGLRAIDGVTVFGTHDATRQTGVVSCTIDGADVGMVGLRLDDDYGILCRVGLHCAPLAHRTIGTFPEGTIRLSPGATTTPEEIDAAIGAIAEMAKEQR